MIPTISIYEQECFGKTHYRVMRNDGLLIFDRHMTDFDSLADAEQAIEGEFRRKKLGGYSLRVVRRGCEV